MSNKGERFQPNPLTRSEAEALITAVSSTSPTGKRNRALIAVLWRGGLRCQEALWLRPYDLDPSTSTVRIMFPKGFRRARNAARARTVAIEPIAWEMIDIWIAAREDVLGAARSEGMSIPADAPLFCAVRRPRAGQPLSSRQVRQTLWQAGQDAKIEKRTAPHQLRHTRATEMARERKDLKAIQGMLGHHSLATTDRYIADLFPRGVVDAMLDSEYARAHAAGDTANIQNRNTES